MIGGAVAPALEALFWDVDGTLAETELEGHRHAFNAAFEELGLAYRWDPATYRRWLSVPGGRERLDAFLTDREGRAASPECLDALVAVKKRHYADLLRRGSIVLRDGVSRVIEAAAAAGLRQMIVTTSSRAAVEALMAGSLAPHAPEFSGWICGDDVLRKKPHPEAYRLALEQAGLDPGGVVVLEDSQVGLAAARAAGLTTLVTLSSLSCEESLGAFAAAAAVVDGLGTVQRPLTVRRGPACSEGMVTLSWLERLLAMP